MYVGVFVVEEYFFVFVVNCWSMYLVVEVDEFVNGFNGVVSVFVVCGGVFD